MTGLPKIALARLKAKPDAPKSPGAPAGPVGFQGAEHPDANLLAAFAEKSLSAKERTQVLDHLVQCAECREVAAFALPAEVAVAEPQTVAAGRRSSPWLVLRWGAMAAALGVLTIVIVQHSGLWNGHPDVSKEATATAEYTARLRQSVPPPISVQPAAGAAQAQAQSEMQESAKGIAAAKKKTESPEDMIRNDQAARGLSREQENMMASSRPPAANPAENVAAANAERKEGGEGNAPAAAALPGHPASPAPAGAPPAAPEVAAKTSADSQTASPPLRATTQNGGFGGGGGSSRGGGGGGFGATMTPAGKSAPQTLARANVQMAAPAAMAPLRASNNNLETKQPPAPLWIVDSDGNVQRSPDGGKTLDRLQIAHDVKFRAVAGIGNQVWAGGTGGFLFHSADGGATWNRVSVSFEGNAIAETITGIQLRDMLHLTVTTASGSRWISEDGGQQWRKLR